MSAMNIVVMGKLKSLLFALLAGLTFAAAAQAQVNLLVNGDFNSSAPGGWMALTSGTATGLAHIITGTNGEDGTPYLEVGGGGRYQQRIRRDVSDGAGHPKRHLHVLV
jgi:hypothetical protein